MRRVKEIRLQSRFGQQGTPIEDIKSNLLLSMIVSRCDRATNITFKQDGGPGSGGRSRPSPNLTPQLFAAVTPHLPALKTCVVSTFAIDERAFNGFLLAHSRTLTEVTLEKMGVRSTAGAGRPQQGWDDLLDNIRQHMRLTIFKAVRPQMGVPSARVPIPLAPGPMLVTTYVPGDVGSSNYIFGPRVMTFHDQQGVLQGINAFLGN